MTTNNLTIGIDLGDRRHAVCVLSAAGEIVRPIARVTGTHLAPPRLAPGCAIFALLALRIAP